MQQVKEQICPKRVPNNTARLNKLRSGGGKSGRPMLKEVRTPLAGRFAVCVLFFIGGSKQCGNIVLRNEQGTEDALCLGCDELLFARYKEQEVYLQNRNQNMYFRAPGSHSPDLHTVFESCGCHLLYSRIEGAFLNRLFSFSSSGSKRWTIQRASSWRTRRPWKPSCSLSSHLSLFQ